MDKTIERPVTRGWTPEAYEALRKWAQDLQDQWNVHGKDLEGDERTRARMTLQQAWLEVHQMATSVAKNFMSRADEAANNLVSNSY